MNKNDLTEVWLMLSFLCSVFIYLSNPQLAAHTPIENMMGAFSSLMNAIEQIFASTIALVGVACPLSYVILHRIKKDKIS